MYACGAVAAAGAPGMSGVSSWTEPQDDSGEETGAAAIWSLQWGGGPKSSEVTVWTPQGPGWKGGAFDTGPFMHTSWMPNEII